MKYLEENGLQCQRVQTVIQDIYLIAARPMLIVVVLETVHYLVLVSAIPDTLVPLVNIGFVS